MKRPSLRLRVGVACRHGRVGDVEASHREAVDLDLAQPRCSDFEPADGERANGKGADGVRLTVTHSDLEPDSAMLQGITRGWPLVLSSLKTLLETGKPLPGTSKRMTKPPE